MAFGYRDVTAPRQADGSRSGRGEWQDHTPALVSESRRCARNRPGLTRAHPSGLSRCFDERGVQVKQGLGRPEGVAKINVSLAHEEALIGYDAARVTATS